MEEILSLIISLCVASITMLVPYTYFSSKNVAFKLEHLKTALGKTNLTDKAKRRLLRNASSRDTRGVFLSAFVCGVIMFTLTYLEQYVVSAIIFFFLFAGILNPLGYRCVNLKQYGTALFLSMLSLTTAIAIEFGYNGITTFVVALIVNVISFKGFLTEYVVYNLYHSIYKPLGFKKSHSMALGEVLHVNR